MSKYIDAEAFKRRILYYGTVHEKDRIPIPFYKRYFAEAYVAMLRWVCDEVDDTPDADTPRWIPVTERLPEKYGRYLVTLDDEGYRSVMPLYYGRIGRISTFYDSDSEYGDVEYCGVIAWMELPEPFNGEVEE